MTFNEPQYLEYESNTEEEENVPTQEIDLQQEQNLTQTSSLYVSIVDDISMVKDGRWFFGGYLNSPIDRLFSVMSALTMAISCLRNREYVLGLLEALENNIVECESYYSNHVQLFSNIINMGRELLNSERSKLVG